MTKLLPDIDELVRHALSDALEDEGAQVFTLWPDTWSELLPLVVARRVAGAALDPRGLDAAVIDVQCAATSRRAAHLLARQVRRALFDACVAQYSHPDTGGYLSSFDEITGPAEIRTGHPAPGADLFRFQATYRLNARPQ